MSLIGGAIEIILGNWGRVKIVVLGPHNGVRGFAQIIGVHGLLLPYCAPVVSPSQNTGDVSDCNTKSNHTQEDAV